MLVTGVYGAGKSTVVADIGGMLEDRGERYGLTSTGWVGSTRVATRQRTGEWCC